MEREDPVSAAWFLLHAHLHREYGDLDSDYLFVGCAVADLFARLSRGPGLLRPPHMFRHTHATRLLPAGVKAEILQNGGRESG